jgi:signal transduction histidine kinase
LRQPLAPIEMALTLLDQQLTPDAAGRARRVIERQTRHLTRLVDDLLDASRVAHGKAELRSTDIDLRDPIQDALHVVAPLAAERQVTIRPALPSGPVPLVGDRQRLQQVFSNLLHNAVKHTPPGGYVDVATEVERDRVTIAIVDTGAGIDPDVLPHVFELFVQGAPMAEGSLGIGLAVVRGLVELHGGAVAASSDGLGHGSRFTVVLPTQPRREPTPVSSPTPPRAPGDSAAGSHPSP